MPDELFRAAHSHNSAPNSDIVGHTPHFVLHFVAVGAKRVPPARSTLILGRVIKASYKFPPCAGGHFGFGTKNAGKVIGGMVADAFCNFSDFQIGVSQVFFCLTNAEFSD